MTEIDSRIMDIIKDGQSGKYKPFIRKFTGKLHQCIQLKNPLDGAILVDDISHILEILNPALQNELDWFSSVQKILKLWVNDKIISNRLLGLKNDNDYDVRAFEKCVLEKFFLSEKPKQGTIIETDFESLVEMVEIGARRFGLY